VTHFVFHDPGWFLALLALPLVARLRAYRKSMIWVVPFAAHWHRSMPDPQPKWRIVAVWVGLAAVVIALARPQLKEEKTNVRTEGHDVMIAIDVSPSMLSEDFVNGATREPVSRLEVVKVLVRAFIEQRPDDRIGVVVFAGRAYTLSPLTFDHEWLLRQLARIHPGLVGDGTAIGDALGVALNRLENPSRTVDGHRAGAFVMLLTDGDNNGGQLSPLEAAEIARTRRIPVFTIGAGLDGNVPFPKFDERGQRIGTEMMMSTLDQMSLVYIAEMTSGKYYRAAGTRSMANAIEQIDRRRKIEFYVQRRELITELFPWIAIVGMTAFGLAFINRPVRSTPPPVAGVLAV
jgi:Ca-activated chloride channel family protein